MSHRSRPARGLAVALVAAALGALSSAALPAQQPSQAPTQATPAPPTPAPTNAPAAAGSAQHEKPVNVQVLKDLSGAQLHDAMVFIAASLGTNCGFCHVRTPQGEMAFDKDDKPEKKTARHMLQMTRSLNEQYFEGRQEVTCSSCHQGRHQPNPAPPLAELAAPGQAETAAAPGRGEGRGGRPPAPAETAGQVVARYLQALGGEERVKAVATVTMRGTVTNRTGEAVPLLVEEALPARYRFTVESKPPSSRGYDGTAAWLQMGPNVRTLEGVQLQYAARLADLGLALRLDKYAALAAVRYDRIDGRDVIWLNGRPAPGVIEMLAFDRSSGLLARRTVRLPTPLGRLPLQIDYADYRDVDGLKLPFEVRVTDWEGVQTRKFTEAKPNAPIDERRFAEPK